MTLFGRKLGVIAKILLVLFLIAIVVALLAGGVFLVRDPSTSRRAFHALAWRVGLQLSLILFLALAFFMGWIKPHGLGG